MDAVIRGTTMPVLEVRLDPGESVVAESGQLGWFDDGIELETTTAAAGADGMWDAAMRTFGGGTFFMTRYQSTSKPGVVAFPAQLPGKIVQVPLGPGRSYLIQRHGFLAGLEGVELSTAFHPGHVGSAALGGFGFMLQKLEGTGHAWLELAGELSEYDLQPGQSMHVHPAHVGLVESGVSYELRSGARVEEQAVRRRRSLPAEADRAGEDLAAVVVAPAARERARAVPAARERQRVVQRRAAPQFKG